MENMGRLGEAADSLRNLLGALELPMPPAFHVEQMKRELFRVMEELRAVYIAETGDNPWL